VDWETVYASGPRGYIDYPTYQPSQDDPGTDEAKASTPTPAFWGSSRLRLRAAEYEENYR